MQCQGNTRRNAVKCILSFVQIWSSEWDGWDFIMPFVSNFALSFCCCLQSSLFGGEKPTRGCCKGRIWVSDPGLRKLLGSVVDFCDRNVVERYHESGYLWEQYDNTRKGEGKGSHPFTGWTSLILLVMAHRYWTFCKYLNSISNKNVSLSTFSGTKVLLFLCHQSILNHVFKAFGNQLCTAHVSEMWYQIENLSFYGMISSLLVLWFRVQTLIYTMPVGLFPPSWWWLHCQVSLWLL